MQEGAFEIDKGVSNAKEGACDVVKGSFDVDKAASDVDEGAYFGCGISKKCGLQRR